MKIFGVPIQGSVFVEADTPEQAFETAKRWADMMLKNSVSDETEEPAEEISIVIVKPLADNIKDATDIVVSIYKEAGVWPPDQEDL